MQCDGCGLPRDSPMTKSGVPRTPKGWRRLPAGVYCPTCKHERYVLRAVTLAVAGPVGATWEDLRSSLRAAWGDVTSATNWMMTRLYTSDPGRLGEKKLPKLERVYLYPDARRLFPELDSRTVSSLEQAVQAKYRAIRYDLRWRHAVSLPTARYPQPLPLSSQSVRIERTEQGWIASVPIQGTRYELRLRGGAQWRRQTRALEQIAEGRADMGECALYQVLAHDGDHRPSPTEKRRTRLMLKVVAWIPRDVARGQRVCTATTTADAFLIARTETGAEWRLNADHIRRASAHAAKIQQRLREDLKAERRFPRPMRAGLVGRMGEQGRKRERQITSWMQESSHQLVEWARRQRCARIEWADTDRGYFAGVNFPWYRFAQLVQQKAERAGMEFASGPVVDETPEALAESEGAGE